jgi:cytochrome d ubiquinol oxidase subunit I
MQQPVGYAEEGGRLVMTDFFALVLNPNLVVQFPHVLLSGLATAAFFVMGISAYHLLRQASVDAFRRSFSIAAIIGSAAAILLALNGHSQAQHMVENQPMKMAAAEALWNTEDPASFSLLTIGDLSGTGEVFSIRLPRLLSLLAFDQLDGEVKGIYDLQAEFSQAFGSGDYLPPIPWIYWSFRIMVGVGFLLILLSLVAVFFVMGEMLETPRRFLRVYVWAIFLPYLATTSGWLMTELGRVPWIVYGLMKIEQGVSTVVSGGMVLTTLLGFTLIYAALIVADVYLLVKFAKAGIPPGSQEQEESQPAALASLNLQPSEGGE